MLLRDMTYADYQIKLYYHLQRNENAYQLSWEQTRFIAYCTIATQTDKIKSPRELMPFPWEEMKKISTRRFKKMQDDAVKTYDAHFKFLQKQEEDAKLRNT